MNDVEALCAKLPQRAIALLDGQDGRYSEWATACAIATYAMNAGLSEDEYVSIVRESDFSYYFATENGRDRSDRLESRLRKAWRVTEGAWNPPLGNKSDVQTRLAALSVRLEQHAWTGKGARSDRAVALALVSWAHEIGVWTIDANVRELGARAGVGRATVSRALVRLTKLGLVSPVEQERDRIKARRWSIELGWNTGRDILGHMNLSPLSESYVPLCPYQVHPVFLASAIGPTAGRLFNELDQGAEYTATEAADALGLNVKTVRRNLDRLVGHGLMVKRAGKPALYMLVHVSVDRLDELAAEYGTLDWFERTADTIDRERAGYAEQQRQADEQRFWSLVDDLPEIGRTDPRNGLVLGSPGDWWPHERPPVVLVAFTSGTSVAEVSSWVSSEIRNRHEYEHEIATG